jgi:hypothetical protein
VAIEGARHQRDEQNSQAFPEAHQQKPKDLVTLVARLPDAHLHPTARHFNAFHGRPKQGRLTRIWEERHCGRRLPCVGCVCAGWLSVQASLNADSHLRSIDHEDIPDEPRRATWPKTAVIVWGWTSSDAALQRTTQQKHWV